MGERWSKTTIAQLVLLVGLFFAVFSPTLASLARSWWSHEQLHGFLVPISLYLVWVRRDELRSLPATPATGPSLPVILLGGILFVLGQVGSVITLNQISLPVVIVGLAILLGGTAQLRVLVKSEARWIIGARDARWWATIGCVAGGSEVATPSPIVRPGAT
jgi:hypothetical protein